MGDKTPNRSAGGTSRRPKAKLVRLALLAAVLASAVVLTGCSEQSQHDWKNLAMPDPGSEQGKHIFNLWRWSWVAALITGGIVWGLMFWAMWRYRRRAR